MYRDLRELYWWPGLKREVADFVSKYLTFQQVKAEHQLPSGLLQPVKIPLWKWERVTMDFVSGLPLTLTKKDVVWVVVDRLTKSAHFIPVRTNYSLQKLAKLCRTPSCWTELGERRVLGPELVSDTDDKVRVIRDRLKAASDRQKSYADLKRKEIEYSVGDFVFLKVSPWKKVLRFGRKELDQIHDVFHVSMLRHYRSDPTHVVSTEEIEVIPDLNFEEEPVQILDRNVKILRKKSIPLVKVLWHNHSSEEAMWEPEEVIRQQYPYLF
ncbi:uncharacterized protein LOC128039923 [Gossypium raimondii]|uniref:uncharacterized protein LOC128039923 n=1 Tax=Gossypium raimondii TaxID=29730 RepID=UPI00227A34F6|nr:uncharacterized protein LOC128039923 [Gossypium raimondii]